MAPTSQTCFQYSVSIIVPVYNSQNTISTTLDSLVNQSLKNIEIICINDGSSDNSKSILSDYAKKFPQIKIINTENQGSFLARSKGIEVARGEYVGFCDADDTAELQMYEKLYNNAKKTKAEIVISAYYRKNKSNILSVEMNRNKGEFEVTHCSGWLISLNTSVWNKLIRTDIAQKHLNLTSKPRISEDALFLLSVYPNVKKVSFLPEPLYNYCANNSKAMSSLSSEEIETIIKSWKEGKSYLFHESKEDFLEIYDLAAFVHLGISIPLVLIQSGNQELQKCTVLLNKALDSCFPAYKTNRFMSLKYVLKHKSFMLLPFFAYIAKKSHILIPLLKIYNLITLKLGKNLKW